MLGLSKSTADADETPTNSEGTPYQIGEVADRLTSSDGEELGVKTTDGEVYAGAYLREEIETALAEDERVPIGYQDDPQTGVRVGSLPLTRLYVHLAINGITGSGKTTLVQTIELVLAWGGMGFVHIDPKGDGDAIELVKRLPEHRLGDLVWVEPNSPRYEKSVAINPLETPDMDRQTDRDSAADRRVDAVKALFNSSDYWGPTMEFITEVLGYAMVRSHHDYALIDMPFIARNQERRENYADEVEDPFIAEAARELGKMSDDDTRPVWKRMAKHMMSPTKRPIISERESTVDFYELIEQDKIVIIQPPDAGGDISAFLGLIYLEQYWSAQRTRARKADGHPSPYFAFVDESDKVLSESIDIEDMLSRARSARLGIGLIAQYAGKWENISPTIADEIKNNTKSKLPLTVDGSDSARWMMESFQEHETRDLVGMDNHQVWAKLPLKSGRGDSEHLLQTAPPMPPLRTTEEAREAIRANLDEYGKTPPTDEEIIENLKMGDSEDYHQLLADVREHDSLELTDQRAREILATMFDLLVAEDDEAESVPMDALLDRLESRLYVDGQKVDTLIHRANSRGLLWVSNDGTQAGFTDDGTELLWDSGNSPNAGGIAHQIAMLPIARALGSIGYDWRVPRQTGEEMPDLYARCPVDTGSGMTKAETDALYETLCTDHPDVVALSGERDVAVEFEKATISAPSQIGHNLRKAVADDDPDHVLFIVNAGNPDGGEAFGDVARKLADKLAEPMLVYTESRTPNDVARRFHHQDTRLLSDRDETRVAVDAETHQWVDDSDGGLSVVLRVPEGDGYREVARFNSLEAWRDRDSADFPVTFASRDDDVTVHDSRDDTLRTFEDEAAMREAGYTPVTEPFVPEDEFDGDLPDRDTWDIGILPNDREMPLQFYNPEEDTCRPLEELAEWDADEGGRENTTDDAAGESDIWDDDW